MDKQQAISFIEEQLATGSISREDLLSLANNASPSSDNVVPTADSKTPDTSSKDGLSKNLINTFYGIGAIIALGGVVILVAQSWSDIGFIGRLVVTLGISLATFVGAFLLSKPSQRVISQVLFTISSVLAPLGVYVLLSEAGINLVWPYTFYTALVLSALFGYALWATKKNILVLVTIGFISWAYYALLFKVLSFSFDAALFKWAGMLLGLSYILIAQGYHPASAFTDTAEGKEKKAVRNILVGLGTLGTLGFGIFVGGIFNLFFIALIFGAFYGSVYLKSRSMLILGALFLMAHIIKLTSQYFVDSIGWPTALIIIGFLVIGVGYMTFKLNKKYIS